MAQMTLAEVTTHGFLVDGKWVEDGDVIEVKAPYDGAVVGRVFQGRRQHAESAVAAAVKAFGTTRRLPAFERQRVLRRVAEGIAQRSFGGHREIRQRRGEAAQPGDGAAAFEVQREFSR